MSFVPSLPGYEPISTRATPERLTCSILTTVQPDCKTLTFMDFCGFYFISSRKTYHQARNNMRLRSIPTLSLMCREPRQNSRGDFHVWKSCASSDSRHNSSSSSWTAALYNVNIPESFRLSWWCMFSQQHWKSVARVAAKIAKRTLILERAPLFSPRVYTQLRQR